MEMNSKGRTDMEPLGTKKVQRMTRTKRGKKDEKEEDDEESLERERG